MVQYILLNHLHQVNNIQQVPTVGECRWFRQSQAQALINWDLQKFSYSIQLICLFINFIPKLTLVSFCKFLSLNLRGFLSRVFLQCQIWVINYYVKSKSKNLSNEKINTGVSVVFKTKRELKRQNKLFFWKQQFFVLVTQNF